MTRSFPDHEVDILNSDFFFGPADSADNNISRYYRDASIGILDVQAQDGSLGFEFERGSSNI